MKVFIGWSGLTSKQLAEALRDWLPNVIQVVEPFMSEEDIPKGSQWLERLQSELADTNPPLATASNTRGTSG